MSGKGVGKCNSYGLSLLRKEEHGLLITNTVFRLCTENVYGSKSYGATPLLNADGSTFLTGKDAMLEQFNSMFNPLSSINDNAINRHS